MQQAKLIDIVKILRLQGRSVQYTKRKDGSIRITRIDSQSYRGSAGNIAAREITGYTLSEARKRQLERIRTPEGRFGNRRKAPLPEAIEKKIRRVQRIWRKNKLQREGYVGKRGTRWTLEHYGEEEALRQLQEQERYGLGLAYTENVNWIINYVNDVIIPKAPSEDLEYLFEFTRIISANKESIKESDIAPIHDLLYAYEHSLSGQRGTSASDLVNELRKLYN